ncbi:MAG: cupin domain-containing protein [Nocardioidaceae bacterium]
MSDVRRLLLPSATDATLPAEIPAGTAVVEGQPTAAVRTLDEVAGAEVGLWEMTPGVARDVEADEVFVVLSGRGTVTFEDGERVELAPGVVVRLHAGDPTQWAVTETLRKVYVGPGE